MKKTFYECKKKERQEKISNRMLISFGYTLIGLFIVFYFKSRIDAAQIGFNAHALPFTIAFYASVVLGIACYVLSLVDKFKPEAKLAQLKYKERFRNYGHLFVVVALVCLYLNLPYFTQGWLKVETAPQIIGFLKNTGKAYAIVMIGLVAYAVYTVAYHMYLYYIKKW